jgi:hypothetical protein
MKIPLIIATLALLSLFPVIYMGKKHFDGTVTTNTYNKGLAYDKNRELAGSFELTWGNTDCQDGVCSSHLSISPAIDAGSLSVSVSRPVGKDLVLATEEDAAGWLVKFRQDGDGFYSRRVDFTTDNVPIDKTDSIVL